MSNRRCLTTAYATLSGMATVAQFAASVRVPNVLAVHGVLPSPHHLFDRGHQGVHRHQGEPHG